MTFVTGRDAAAFIADDNYGGLMERDFVDSLFGPRVSGVQRYLAVLDFGQERFPTGYREWQPEQGTGGGAEGLGIPGADGPFQEYDTGGAEGFGGTDDGAGVTGILNAIEGDDEGVAFEAIGDGLVVDLDEGDDALAVFDRGNLGERGSVDNVRIGGAV